MSLNCSDCKHSVLVDYGYSNYTVEGTNVYCIKKLHPNPGFDNWYGENKDEGKFAEGCSGYDEGQGILIDCERDALCHLTDEQRKILNTIFPQGLDHI